MTVRLLLLLAACLSLLFSCSRVAQRGETTPQRAPSGGEGKWQTVWVDPQIIEAGKTFTVIRSDRLDSVMVEKNIDYTLKNTPSLTFRIETRACEARVELLDSRDKLITVLTTRRLEPGYYKISVDERTLQQGVYSVRALYCGQSSKKTFAVTT